MFPGKPTGSMNELYSNTGSGAARRQAEAARRLLQEGTENLATEQEEMRPTYKHAYSRQQMD